MDNRIREYFTDKVLSEAAGCFGLSIDKLTPLDGFENFIYEFEREGKGFILRISHTSRRTPEMIEAEMHWIAYLHQNQVNCSIPLKSANGHLVEVVGKGEHRFVVCAFDKVPGCRTTIALDTKEFRFNYGKQVGRMHRITRDYLPGATQRMQWFEDELVSGFDRVVPPEETAVMERMRANTAEIQAMQPHRDNYGLVHFDVHTGNLFVHHNEIYIFDFDDSQYAYFAADIAIIMFYFAGRCPRDISREDFIREFYRDFMEGYNSQYQLPDTELAKIPVFLKQRELMLYAAIMQAYSGTEYDGWANWYMTGRKEKLEQDIPFLDMIFV